MQGSTSCGANSNRRASERRASVRSTKSGSCRPPSASTARKAAPLNRLSSAIPPVRSRSARLDPPRQLPEFLRELEEGEAAEHDRSNTPGDSRRDARLLPVGQGAAEPKSPKGLRSQ